MPYPPFRSPLALFLLTGGLLLAQPAVPAAEKPDDPDGTRSRRRTPVVEVFDRNKDAVVYVTGPLVQGDRPTTREFFALAGEKKEQISLGTGFLIHPDGYVVTNAHAVEKVISYEVRLADGKKVDAELIAIVRNQDLALLKVDAGRSLPAVRMAAAGDVMIGETVVVIANPHGLLHTCTKGIVSAVGRSTNPSGLPGVTLHDLIQTDAAINAGSSGGPWFNIAGQILGVTTTRKADSDNIGFAISVNSLRKELPGMLDTQRRYGLLTGLAVAPRGRAEVIDVEADSPAAVEGIRVGDRIVRVGRHAVRDRADLALALVGCRPGQQLPLKLLRDGQPVTAELLLAARPKPDGCALLEEKFGLTAVPLDEAKARSTLMRIACGVVITKRDAERYTEVDDPPRPGDVLARINKIRPRDLDHLGILLDRIQPGDSTTMVLLRKDGDTVTRIDLTTPAR